MNGQRFTRIILLMGLLTILGFTTVSAETESEGSPRAVISEPHATFGMALEGTEVSQEFTISNTGSGTLEIRQVQTG